jgi:hypothetical protein
VAAGCAEKLGEEELGALRVRLGELEACAMPVQAIEPS